MGHMKELLTTIYAGGDEAVAAVERIGKDWREQLEQAASEIERLRGERNQWMHNAMAHEQIAAELRARLMESPADCP